MASIVNAVFDHRIGAGPARHCTTSAQAV